MDLLEIFRNARTQSLNTQLCEGTRCPKTYRKWLRQVHAFSIMELCASSCPKRTDFGQGANPPRRLPVRQMIAAQGATGHSCRSPNHLAGGLVTEVLQLVQRLKPNHVIPRCACPLALGAIVPGHEAGQALHLGSFQRCATKLHHSKAAVSPRQFSNSNGPWLTVH